MNTQIGTINHNWMDENNRNKIDQKLLPNLPFPHPQHDHARNQDFPFKDNYPLLQSQPFFGGYDFLPSSQLYLEGLMQIDKELPLSYQEIPFQHNEMIGFPPAEREVFKLYKHDFPINYIGPGMIHNSNDVFPIVVMGHEYMSRPQMPISMSEKMVKLQQPSFLLEDHRHPDFQFKHCPIQYTHPSYLYDPQPQYSRSHPQPAPESQYRERRYRNCVVLGGITRQQRNSKIRLYLEKKKRRNYVKKVSYDCRKKVADQRIRIKGRFVTKKQAMGYLKMQQDSEVKEEDVKNNEGSIPSTHVKKENQHEEHP